MYPSIVAHLDMCRVYKIDSFTLANTAHLYKKHKGDSTPGLKLNEPVVGGQSWEKILEMGQGIMDIKGLQIGELS